jgi:hypothetical protein
VVPHETAGDRRGLMPRGQFPRGPRGHRAGHAGRHWWRWVPLWVPDPPRPRCQEATPPSGGIGAGSTSRALSQRGARAHRLPPAKARGHRELVTVIGHAAIISAGEWITATGDWVNDRTHGQQFKARFLRTSAPTSADGIEKYLSSGMIRGVGPAYAKKLVRAFGEKVFASMIAW